MSPMEIVSELIRSFDFNEWSEQSTKSIAFEMVPCWLG